MIEQKIKELGLTYAVAGGYARDLYYGLKPRDKDIIVAMPIHENMGQIVKLELFLQDHYDMDAIADDHYNCDRIAQVWKCKDNVDVVLYHAPTIEKCVAQFDYNINQFIMSIDVPIFIGKDKGTLVCIREDKDDKRKAYIQAKAKQIGWRV
jgi:hypothetical protein